MHVDLNTKNSLRHAPSVEINSGLWNAKPVIKARSKGQSDTQIVKSKANQITSSLTDYEHRHGTEVNPLLRVNAALALHLVVPLCADAKLVYS